jgi:hypothetical protein
LDEGSFFVAQVISGFAGSTDIESVSVAVGPGLAVIPLYYTFPAHLLCGTADGVVRMLVAHTCKVEASWKVSSHNITTSTVEHRLLDAGVGGAKSLPISKGGVKR